MIFIKRYQDWKSKVLKDYEYGWVLFLAIDQFLIGVIITIGFLLK